MRYSDFRIIEDKSEDDQKKERVIRALNKKRADDPIFDKTYKLIVGPALTGRIENYIAAHKDPDIGAEEMAYLIKAIPDLGTTEEVKKFVTDWNAGKDFVNLQELIPASGMDSPAPLQSVVDDEIAKKLFIALSRQNFTKSDAGPAEAAFAIMSKKISYSSDGGDLIIDGKKIEVKGGGKSAGAGGGRVYNDRKSPKQELMTKVLEPLGFKGNISVVAGTKELPENFPKEDFIKACSQAWFGEVRNNLVKTFGTPQFRLEWNKALYDDYKEEAGHEGILIIGASSYKYIVNGEQLYNTGQASKGALYYPSSRQTRDLGIQVSIG